MQVEQCGGSSGCASTPCNDIVAMTTTTTSSGPDAAVPVVSSSKCDAGTVTCNVGVMTDPDCLGPCEPGTSIVLEGIVWSESNNGKR